MPILLLLFLLLPLFGWASSRQLQYTPDADGYITCHNGKNLYTRALYGGPTLWRLETSDRPIFGAYHKTDNRNIHFAVDVKGKHMRLDSTAFCESLYRGGERIYRLSDPAWGKGRIILTAVALPDSDGAVWEVRASSMPKGSTLTAYSSAIAPVKLSRSGDLGADPPNAFAPHPDLLNMEKCTVGIAGKEIVKYIGYADRRVTSDDQSALAARYAEAQHYLQDMANRIVIETPDPYVNTLGATLSAAGEGIYDGTTYLHGAVGWRQPLSGWRGAYTGDFLGWHDRARRHFDAYATSQVTDVEPVIPHPSQDTTLNLARAEKRWGTQMYSRGYICRNPGRNDQMHHYDMNLCYIDELLWHLQWTGDLDYARKVWPVIKSSLEWEKRNFDPDDDGLYDAYCCIWASDALYYNNGGVTHSSAYNYRANRLAAEIAALIGEDPAPYAAEAEKILNAINTELWIPEKGVWAEYRDMMGNNIVHDHPGLWTIYHAIDSDVATPLQAYLAAGYVDRNIPHIPVVAEGLKDEGYAVISTTDWLPYAWSINNVAFAEGYHTALALWEAGRKPEAFKLLKSAILDGMFLGDSPANIGQVSYYDAARGECYRDFADPVGVLSRAVMQGLFGFTPEALSHKVVLRPGWPSDWRYARISHPDFAIDFSRVEASDIYRFDVDTVRFAEFELRLEALRERVSKVTVNGSEAAWTVDSASVGRPCIRVSGISRPQNIVEIVWDGSYIAPSRNVAQLDDEEARIMRQGDMVWWVPTDRQSLANSHPTSQDMGIKLFAEVGAAYEPVDMKSSYNASVTDIFHNSYVSPRSPYTTLQIPVHGIGEWCHPLDSASIDDSALRGAQGAEVSVCGVPFHTPASGDNVAFVSLFDNYPTSLSVPLTGRAKAINLLLAGSTNHMQCYVDNAYIDVEYVDGSSTRLPLVPPYNWCPIEQDYYIDGYAFAVPTERPYRITLKDGVVSNDLGKALVIDEVYGRRIDGGAATALSIALDPTKPLKALHLTAHANDIVAGILAATYVR